MTFSAIRDLTPAYESLSYLLPHAAWILVTQGGIRVAVSTLMWHQVNQDGRGPGTDAGRGACGTPVTGQRGPRRRDGRGCGAQGNLSEEPDSTPAGQAPGKATGYLLTRPYGAVVQLPAAQSNRRPV